MEQVNNAAVVAVKGINDKMPDNMKKLFVGETIITDAAEITAALRQYVRAKVLKQYNITSVNRNAVSAPTLGFGENNVQTGLKLPKVITKLNGDYAEPLEAYYKRALPFVQQWFRNSMFNSIVSEAIVATLD